MKMFTFRLTKQKIIITVAAIALIATLIVSMTGGKKTQQPEAASGATAEQRIAFLKECGWEVDPAPVESREVQIPGLLDDVLQNYNEVQKNQGYDLELYAGKLLVRYTYQVLNYPGGEQRTVLANVLVYNGNIVGGDICCNALDGFMHGFRK